jgi:hypothetical protein
MEVAALLLNEIRRVKANQLVKKMLAVRQIFPPSLNINKFIVGSIYEELLVRAFKECSFTCENVASTSSKVDIHVTFDSVVYPYSIKSMATLKTNVILENYRGNKKPFAQCAPTFLIVLDDPIYILYFDHAILTLHADPAMPLYIQNDSTLMLNKKQVKQMIPKLDEKYKIVLERPIIEEYPVCKIEDILTDFIEKMTGNITNDIHID